MNFTALAMITTVALYFYYLPNKRNYQYFFREYLLRIHENDIMISRSGNLACGIVIFNNQSNK